MKRLLFAIALLPATLHAQEQPIVSATVTWCEWHAPYNVNQTKVCRSEQLFPSEYSTVTLIGCMRAVSMGAASFYYDGSWWDFKKAGCKESPNEYAAWRKSQDDERLANTKAGK